MVGGAGGRVNQNECRQKPLKARGLEALSFVLEKFRQYLSTIASRRPKSGIDQKLRFSPSLLVINLRIVSRETLTSRSPSTGSLVSATVKGG